MTAELLSPSHFPSEFRKKVLRNDFSCDINEAINICFLFAAMNSTDSRYQEMILGIMESLETYPEEERFNFIHYNGVPVFRTEEDCDE